MAELGVLTTGAGVKTTITRDFVPAFVVIGDVKTNLPIQGFTVTIGGKTTIAIQGQSVIQAMAKYLQECLLGVDVKIGMALKLAGGLIPNQGLQMVFENAGATTPTVYGFSDNRSDSVPVLAGQMTMQATSSQLFRGGDFTALFFSPTNFDYAQMTFEDGHSDKFTGVELAALFNLNNQCDADGRLAGLIVIDNKEGNIRSVELYTTSGGTLQVSNLKA